MFERLMHACLVTPSSPQNGLRSALRGIAGEYREFSWIPYWNKRQLPQMRAEFLEAVKAFNPTMTFMQIQTDGVFPSALIDMIPGIKIEWGGDLRAETSAHYFSRAKAMDVVLMSNHRDIENLRKAGYTADYLQIGVDPIQFSPDGPTRSGTPEIVAMLNNYPDRFERSRFRAQMVAALRARYGSKFAVYGNGWGTSDVWLNEDDEAAAYRTCRIAVSAEHFANVPGFCSDRVFRATACGACLLSHRFVSFDEHFKDGVEAVAWTDLDDLFRCIDMYLEREDERKAIAAAGQIRTATTHSWASRMVELQAIIEKYQAVTA